MKSRTMIHTDCILNGYFFKMHGFLENYMYFLENWYFSGNSACFALENLKKKLPVSLHAYIKMPLNPLYIVVFRVFKPT
jgi:hypothetical protein